MKKGLFIFCILFFSAQAFAGHIAGGEVYYKYLGPGSSANTLRYEITLRLFRECIILVPNTAAMPGSVVLSIFNMVIIGVILVLRIIVELLLAASVKT